MKIFNFILIFLFLGAGWVAELPQSWAQGIYIDPQESKAIVQTQPPFLSKTLLALEDLPQTSPDHQAIQFQNKSFTHLSLSPDGQKIAFSVAGVSHGWSGIFSLGSKDVQQLALCFEGKTAEPHWSEDGRFLAVEEKQARNTYFFELFDLQEGKQCRLDGRAARNKFLNFFEPWWSPKGDKIFFKVEYNNTYRKAVGLKPKKFSNRIGEADLNCKKIKFYTVKEFMKKFPEESQNELISQTEEKPSL